jgi:hypothetical protein
MSAPIEAVIPPVKIVMQLISGKCLSRCVSLAAELGIDFASLNWPRLIN